MNSKGFRDEDGNFITIPGESVKYDAMSGHIARFDENGNIVDGGDAQEEFAPASHAHSSIVDTYSHTDNGISVDNSGINISVDNGESSGEVDITAENIGNLYRALKNPSSTPEDDNDKLITSKAAYDALNGKMGALKEIFIDCDTSGGADAWEIRPDAAGEAAFRAALTWGNNAPRLVVVNITKGEFGTTNLKTYRTIGSIHATAVEVNVAAYDLTAEIYVDGHVFTRTGESFDQEETWGQGLRLASNDIFTHTSNS